MSYLKYNARKADWCIHVKIMLYYSATTRCLQTYIWLGIPQLFIRAFLDITYFY